MTDVLDADAIDQLGREWADLQARQSAITERLNTIKQTFAQLEPGRYPAAGLTVSVRNPSRSFNVDKAVGLLPEQVRETCLRPATYDPKLVKQYLAPVLLDACMVPGTGAKVVTIS